MNKTPDSPTEGSTRTVDRAIAVLKEVCADGEVSLTLVARRANLPASTALRLLNTLEASGFVERDSSANYAPGPRLLQLGAEALGRNSLVRLSQPALDHIVELTGESAYFSVRGPGDTAIYLAMAEGTHSVRHTSWAGRSVPLEGRAVGVALAGNVGDAGFVVQVDAQEVGVTAISAPVYRFGGVVGAISILGPTYRVDPETTERYGQILVQEATELSRTFGAIPRKHEAVGT